MEETNLVKKQSETKPPEAKSKQLAEGIFAVTDETRLDDKTTISNLIQPCKNHYVNHILA